MQFVGEMVIHQEGAMEGKEWKKFGSIWTDDYNGQPRYSVKLDGVPAAGKKFVCKPLEGEHFIEGDLCASMGKYNDASGRERTRYMWCGYILTAEGGTLTGEIAIVPMEGRWLNVFLNENEGRKTGGADSSMKGVADDLPF